MLQVQTALRRVYVAQEPQFDAGVSVFDAVAEGVAEARALRERFERHDAADDLDAVQTRLEALDGWTWEQRVAEALQRLQLDGGAAVEPCPAARRSASRWRRRWSPSPTCCCSTNRPTTSTSTPSSGCRACS